MYTIYSGSASLLFKKIYNNSDKHVTLLLETALDTQLIPSPGALFLGSLGLSISGWLLRRQKETRT